MKPFLLYEQYPENNRRKVPNENELVQDLNLHVIFRSMARDDSFLYHTAGEVVLKGLSDLEAITYRQKIVEDCIKSSTIISGFYNISSRALKEAALYKEYTQPNYARIVPVSVRVIKSAGLLELLVNRLEELREISREKEKTFQSKGMVNFCKMLDNNLTDRFFAKAKEHIRDLSLITEGGKMVIGAKLGNGIKGSGYVLRELSEATGEFKNGRKPLRSKEYNVIPLDNTSIAKSAREIEEAGLIHILRVINHFISTTTGFFELLRYEAGFYVGCTNLYHELSQIGLPLSFPVPTDKSQKNLSFTGIYDMSMSINGMKKLVTNSLHTVNASLFIITGANQGGKSTFLRSIGLSQILMQCGMFVPASYFTSNICDNVFTHFTREEDSAMESGKLDEELLRMNAIVNSITPQSLLLMNEPFATTTERDGSKIAADIVTAFYELGIKVIFVTHLFEFAHYILNKNFEGAVFLRAERYDSGERSFCIKPGEPLQTSFGEDLYNSVI